MIKLPRWAFPPYLLAATLRGVLSQRLVRRLCSVCGGAGCDVCNGSGRKGRIVVSELLKIGKPLVRAISDDESAADLERKARENGFLPLSESGLFLVETGEVSQEDMFH